ncbi:nitroreductase family protein [Paenibacillus caui]|uniref:nitroreductase family protein n=1 Tax=Paenibacillus caui TaxID=2873927 RepID=UPI001CA98CA3|nr:nitroreductase [Paenibacillus caui]
MNIFEAIRTRRSIGRVSEEEVPRESIERILEAGTWAPNHRRTEPWKFFVLRGEGRKKLGLALAEIAKAEAGAVEAEELDKLESKALDKAKRAPLVIAVAVEPTEKEGVIELEEYGAVFAAIQNMLLEAHGLGLASVWRTGEPAYHPIMNKHFGLSDKGKMLGFLYIGKPALPSMPEGKRESYLAKTVWIDEV